MYVKHKSIKESAYHTPYQIYITRVHDNPTRSFYEVLFAAGFTNIRVMEVSTRSLDFTAVDILYNEKQKKRMPVGAQPLKPDSVVDCTKAEDVMRTFFKEKEKRIDLEAAINYLKCTLTALEQLKK